MQAKAKVKGVEGLQQVFRLLAKDVKKRLQKELRRVAEPAAEGARNKAQSLSLNVYTVSGIRPGSRVGMAIVRQNRRSTTKKRPDFGNLQMRRVLEPAAVETMPEAVARLEQMLDTLANDFNG